MNLPASVKPGNIINYRRFIELDVLRGLAIIFMIYLHVLWDLDYFGIMPINNEIYKFQKIVPIMFFVLVGMCLTVSRNRQISKPSFDEKKYDKHLFLRGLKILLLGMFITLITMIFLPDKPIFFGVLHCIGLSIILSIPFLKFKSYNLLFGAMIIIAGLTMNLFPVEDPTILHLAVGFHQGDVAQYTIDYFPLYPWFGICLVGITLGNILYKDNERRFKMPDLSRYKPAKMFSWLGQHSLAIYLVHQPIIAGTLSVFLFL
jgi:uncharacterized membrane protein